MLCYCRLICAGQMMFRSLVDCMLLIVVEGLSCYVVLVRRTKIVYRYKDRYCYYTHLKF